MICERPSAITPVRSWECPKCRRPMYESVSGWRHGQMCKALMRNTQELCARGLGHKGGRGGGHRTAYAMENEMRMRSGRGMM